MVLKTFILVVIYFLLMLEGLMLFQDIKLDHIFYIDNSFQRVLFSLNVIQIQYGLMCFVLLISGEYIQLTNQLEDILQDVLEIDCNDLDKPTVSFHTFLLLLNGLFYTFIHTHTSKGICFQLMLFSKMVIFLIHFCIIC